MNRYKAAYDKMERDGADPRRAMPRSSLTPLIHVVRNAHGWLLFVVGVGTTLLAMLAIAMVFGLRPASETDIRLAAIVRAGVAHPEAMAIDDLLGRLALPARQSRVLASLLGHPAPARSDWLSALTGKTPLRLDPGQIEAVGHLLRRLAAQDDGARVGWLDRLAELDRVARDPDAEKVLTIVGNLAREDLHALVASGSFRRVLEEIAGLTPRQRDNLLIVGLNTIPEDSARAVLLRALATMDPVTVMVLDRWRTGDLGQHNAMRFILQQLDARDLAFGKLLSAYYRRLPALTNAIRSLPPMCSFADARSCR